MAALQGRSTISAVINEQQSLNQIITIRISRYQHHTTPDALIHNGQMAPPKPYPRSTLKRIIHANSGLKVSKNADVLV